VALKSRRRTRSGRTRAGRVSDANVQPEDFHELYLSLFATALLAGNQDFHIVSQLPGGELIIDERVVFAFRTGVAVRPTCLITCSKVAGRRGISPDRRFKVRMGLDPRLFAGSVSRLTQCSK
jgi:hypothetical protein